MEILKEKRKVSWNDLHSGTQQEIKKTYGLNDRQLERQVRQHLDGASSMERRLFYQGFYSRRK